MGINQMYVSNFSSVIGIDWFLIIYIGKSIMPVPGLRDQDSVITIKVFLITLLEKTLSMKEVLSALVC